MKLSFTKQSIEDAIPVDAKDGLIGVCEPDGSFGSRSWYVKYAFGSDAELAAAEAGIKEAFPEVRTRCMSFPGPRGGDFIIITPPYKLNDSKKSSLSENQKITLTFSQLKRLIK